MYKTSRTNFKLNQRVVKRLEQGIASIHAYHDGNLSEISIFGSYANGDPRKFSSIDLLIVLKESEERFIRRNATMQRLLNEDDETPAIDPLVYTEQEILELIKKKESFIISVLKESIVVWNEFGTIDLSAESASSDQPHSRYQSAIPNLEEIDFSD